MLLPIADKSIWLIFVGQLTLLSKNRWGVFGYTGIVISYPILHGTAWLTTKIPKIPAIKLPIDKCLEQVYKTPSYILYLILFGWLIFRKYLKKHNVNICHNCKKTEEQIESWNQYCLKKRWNK